MIATEMTSQLEFRVVDAMDAPHGGQILRLQLEKGKAPATRKLRNARLTAESPDGEKRTIQVSGFPLFAGRPSNERFAETGAIQLHVKNDDATGSPIRRGWIISMSDG